MTHRDRLLGLLISRNPNGMRPEQLTRLLDDLTVEQISAAAQDLQAAGLIEIRQHPNTHVPGRVITTYQLTTPGNYPIQETIIVGAVEFPRALHGDVLGAEDLNGFIEAIADYNATVEGRVTGLAERLVRRYWVNTAAVLGLFVALFALILKGSAAISTSTSGSAGDLFWRNAAALGPLALILFGFVFLLGALLRRG